MIDPRYLVRASCLPFIPDGVVTCYQRDGLRVHECLDLSAPPKRGDIPERLDALGWALAVLAKRINANPIDIDDIRPMDWNGNATTWEVRNRSGYVAILTPEDDGWEEYDPADPDQPRRIVAAALRKTHVQKVSP